MHAVIDARHTLFRLLHRLFTEMKRVAVMSRQHQIAQGLRLLTGQNLVYIHAVSKRLRHFFVIDVDVAIVHPVAGQRLAVQRLRLRHLALVMRENEVAATAVNVDRARPRNLCTIVEHSICQPGRPFPQGLGQEISDGLACFHSTKSLRPPFSHSPRHALRASIDPFSAPTICRIPGKTKCGNKHLLRSHTHVPSHETRDKVDDLVHIFRHARMHIRILDPECAGIFKIGSDKLFRYLRNLLTGLAGFLDQLVINIRKLTRTSLHDRASITAHHIEKNDRSRIADMNVIVHGRSANVHFHFPRLGGWKGSFFVSSCCIYATVH